MNKTALRVFGLDPDHAPMVDGSINRNIEWDISSLNHSFSREAFGEIIESPDLFWLAFCKAFGQTDTKGSIYFSASLKENKIKVLGKEHVITGIQKNVEEIRKIFLKGVAKKDKFIILPIEIAHHIYIRDNHNYMDLTDFRVSRKGSLLKEWFEVIIAPTMDQLSKSLGASFSKVAVPIELKSIREKMDPERIEVQAFQIDCAARDYFVHLIPPRDIRKRDVSTSSMYSQFQEQILCDLSLVAKDGVVKVHSTVLSEHGGEVFQKILTSNMKESSEKTIHFGEFSINTVRSFADFLYLGEDGLKPESINEKDLDLVELFYMANTYQVEELIDCCTNLFSVFSSTDDMNEIEDLSDLFANEHLKDLHESL